MNHSDEYVGILPLFMRLRDRRIQPELLDRSDLEPRLREEALRGLRTLNRLSLTALHLWRPVRELAGKLHRPIRVLDVASGGGDLAVSLALRAARAKLPIEVHGCDISDASVAYASARARDFGSHAKFFAMDVLRDRLPAGYDVIMNSLFMHHLERAQAEHLLRSMRDAGPRLIVISDLIRSQAGYALAHLACRVFTRSYVVHHDGPRSVLAAFTTSEFSALADRAGLSGHHIEWCWPCRFVFTWESE